MAATISLSDDVVFTALRAFIIDTIGPGPEVVRGLSNGVAMPTAPFICLTSSANTRLSTPHSNYTDPVSVTGSRDYTQPMRYTVSVDCYGPDSAQWAAMIRTLFETPTGADALAPNVQPLWADDPQQLALVNGEYQFEQRWTFNCHVQYSPVISTPQQFADQLEITLIEVDTHFPA